MSYGQVLYEVSEGVATITLNRPERMNALGPVNGDELLDALNVAGDDDDVRAVILTANGRV